MKGRAIDMGWLVFMIVGMMACNHKRLTPNEYVEWVNDPGNGLHTVNQIGSVKVDILHTPTAYMVLREAKGKKLDTALYNQMAKEFQDLDFFTLRLSDKSKDLVDDPSYSRNEIGQRLYYFSFGLQDDISLEVEGKSLPCRIFHYEKSYDLTPVKTFVLAFDKVKTEEDKIFVIHADKLGIGKLKIRLENEKLKHIPLLEI
jgi:hypothetical protein